MKGENLRPTHGESSLPIVHQERDELRREIGFLNSRGKGAYLGVLTNSGVDIVSTIYPSIADGILRVYNFVEKEATDSLSPQGFLNRHLRNAYMLGTLLSNEEVTELRKKMDAGGFSEQFDAYKRFREADRW